MKARNSNGSTGMRKGDSQEEARRPSAGGLCRSGERVASRRSAASLPVLLALLLLALAVVPVSPAQGQSRHNLLHDLYGQGYLLADSDGDSLADVVRGRLVLSDRPSEEQVITAANLAARLGYETTAMDLDLLCSYGSCPEGEERPALLVGDPQAFGLDVDDLSRAPGQGSVRRVEHPHFPGGAVLVDGYDATGLLAAGNYLSGRYPDLDEPGSGTWTELRERIKELVRGDSASAAGISLESFTLSDGRKGVSRASMRLQTADVSSFRRLADSLSGDASAAWRGALDEASLYRLTLELVHGDSSRTVRLAADASQPEREGGDPQGGGDPDFALQEFYTTGGIYRDTNGDEVADDLQAYISWNGTKNAASLVRLAARVGLETAGMRLPLVYPGGDEQHPENLGFPVIMGPDAYILEQLRGKGGLLENDSQPGDGYIEFLTGRIGDKNGVVLYGSDAAGRGAAADYLARRLPWQWNYGKGEWRLEETQTGVRRFLQGVDGAGQVAAGVEKLRTWMERLEVQPEEVSVHLAAEETPQGLDAFLEGLMAERWPGAKHRAQTRATGFGVGDTVFAEQVSFPWEVDTFWEHFEREVEPELGPASFGRIELRVSEAPQVRDSLAGVIRTRLRAAGVPEGAVEVEVLSAYKQGYSWLADRIIPRLEGREVATVHIDYRHLRDAEEIKWQAAVSPTRWLQEIYPIDGVMTRRLGVADSAITFRPFYGQEGPTYRLAALDAAGDTLLADTFNPRYTVRSYFDHFPKYDSVRVTTGWVEADIDGRKLLNRRIRTDIEAFWDHLQGSTYPKIVDYVMDIQEGRPDEDLAPFFDAFRLDVTLSEPDYQIGFLREQISSTEALHEDLYFETLLLFDLIGNRYGVGGLDYPGRILPFIHPPEHGQPGRASISLTGKQEARPRLELRYRESGGETRELSYTLPNAPVEDPVLRAVKVRESYEGVGGLYFEVPVDTADNPYPGLKERDPEYAIDRTFVSAERVRGIIAALGDLHEAGLFRQTLSWDRVEEVGFRFTKDDSLLDPEPLVLRRSAAPASTEPPALPDVGAFTYEGQNLVQWQHAISPEENNRIMARMNTFDNISVYHAATSLLGNEVFAMDLLPPTPSTYRSQAKMNALKPTLFISGRQHANEFSSTSHMLKLAEKVATDSTYRRYLDRVNLVLHPVTNPDGAELSIALHELNPYHMNHAAYLGPLGVDIPRDQNQRDPRYEVAKVRRVIHQAWLPDIYINMHGYPPHEWVQYFAGYSAWMTGRERGPNSNNYWIPRGYFLTGFNWYDHEDHPFNKELSFALLDSISTRVNDVPAMRRVNEEMQRRYRKYRSQEDAYGEFYRNGLWVNAPLEGRTFTGSGFSDPDITYFTLTSEAPDEPARDDWMEMNAAAGLAHSTAVLQYLYHGLSGMEIEAEMESGRVRRARYRVKPVLPEKFHRLRQEKEEDGS
ncbi:MAG: M14 family zinc carboxypeptidase [Balneolaceae bacterium]|nr:M14 family zinc carboxypeptidase [Balneolaceae bacterium]